MIVPSVCALYTDRVQLAFARALECLRLAKKLKHILALCKGLVFAPQLLVACKMRGN